MNLTQAPKDDLAFQLQEHGLAEKQRGYGHATGEDVADFVASWLEDQKPPSHPSNDRDNWGRVS